MRVFLPLRPLVHLAAIWLASASLLSCSSTKQEKNIIKAPTTPEIEMLQNAMNTYDQQLYRVSMQSWIDLRDGYPNSYFATLAELKIADAQFFAGDYPAALVSYEEFGKLHPGHEAMPYVRYQIGNCHLAQYRDITHDQGPLQSAIKAFQNLITQHPRSEYLVLGRRRMRKARELQAEYERYVASFYEKRGLDSAASSRLKHLATNYPETKAFSLAEAPVIDETTSPSGKIPDRPRMLPSLDSTVYVSRLSQIRSRLTSLSEEDLVESETPRVAKRKESQIQSENPLISVDCEEQEQGAIFVATLDRGALATNERNYKLAGSPIGVFEPQSCTAGGVTVSFRKFNGQLIIDSETKELQSMALTRPDRVVVIAR